MGSPTNKPEDEQVYDFGSRRGGLWDDDEVAESNEYGLELPWP